MNFTIVLYKNKRTISAHNINKLLHCKRRIRDNIAREPVKDSFYHVGAFETLSSYYKIKGWLTLYSTLPSNYSSKMSKLIKANTISSLSFSYNEV